MNDLQIFESEEFGQVRTITEGDKTLFCGTDVATALGYAQARKAVERHCRCGMKRTIPHPQSVDKTIEMTFIPESDIYRLIISSKLPAAEKFEHWVFEDVLPTIRKHGIYMTDQRLQEMLMRPDTIINIALTLKREQLKNIILTEDNAVMQPKADYFDALVDRNLLTNIRETAKELKIPERQFVSFLIDNGFLYRSPKGSLMPYKKYAEGGLFELKECANERTGWFGVQLLVTPKGRETFRLLCANTEGNDNASAIQTK
ncbi:MAG: phage antirepressor KilAC domain-containing protein [Christensenella sp.]